MDTEEYFDVLETAHIRVKQIIQWFIHSFIWTTLFFFLDSLFHYLHWSDSQKFPASTSVNNLSTFFFQMQMLSGI